MSIVLFLLSVLAGLAGVISALAAKSAVHEIAAGVCFVVASILLVGSLLLETLRQILKRLPEQK